MPGQLVWCHSYRRDVLKGRHSENDSYRMAIYTREARLDAETEHYSSAHEVVGEGYKRGGLELTGFNAQIRGAGPAKVVTLDFDNPTIDPSSITGQQILIYNDSLPSRDAVAVGDLGTDITSVNGPWSPGFPAPGFSTSMLQW